MLIPRFKAVAILLLLASVAAMLQAGPADDEYVELLGRIQEADTVAANGDAEGARRMFAEVLPKLRVFQVQNPGWHTEVLAYRIRYVEQRTAGGAPAVPLKATNTPVASGISESQSLQNRVAQLEQERMLLQAKLREALAGRPAALEPVELERAAVQMREQRQELDALRVEVARLKAGPTNAPSVQGVEEVERLKAELAAWRAREVRLVERARALEKRVAELETAARATPAAPATLAAPGTSAPVDSARREPGEPLSLMAALELAGQRLDRLDAAGAADALARAPASAGTNVVFVTMQARVYIAQGRPGDAVRVLGAVMQAGPVTAETQHQLGRALLAQGSDEAARSALNKAVAMDPSCWGAHLALAGALARREPPDMALARWHYGRALQTGGRRDATVERLLGIPAASTNAAPVLLPAVKSTAPPT